MLTIYRSATFILFFLFVNFSFSQDALTPLTVKTESTYENIGIVWNVLGDENFNSSLTIEYKKAGDSDFLPTYTTMRANPNSIVDGSELGFNHHAGSIVGLLPNTAYTIKLTLIDPDGGGTTQSLTVWTRKEIPEEFVGTDYYVIPGDGGGTGTLDNPFLGLQEAADHAVPGVIFNLAEGVYAPFLLTESGTSEHPIVFTANSAEDVVIDGADSDIGIITLGSYDDSLQHVVIENIKIQNGKWGIDAQNTQHVTVRYCTFMDVSYGYLNRRENGWEHDQTISDNYFYGRTDWPVEEGVIPPERCIDIRGNRNVVRYNYIRNFGDGVSTDGPPYLTSYALDIHNNDIANIGDDLIEVDGMVANTRVWNNKCTNGRMGISLAPVYGGPCYVYRNVFNNMEISTYKMNRKPAGLIIVHNSAIKEGRGTTSNSGWHNTLLRNNVLISSHYCFEEYGLVENSLLDDWDFNGYASERSGLSGEPWFKWDSDQYLQLIDLSAATSQEENGIQFDHVTAIEDVVIASVYEDGIEPDAYNFGLSTSSPLIDQGENIPNLNDAYVTDGAPDLGAYEYGKSIPHYGPRELGDAGDLEQELLNPFEVYYAKGADIITLKSEEVIKKVFIYNVNGQVVFEGDFNAQNVSIKASGFSTGIFFVSINHNYNSKVVISK